jgi:hypothetical protein
MEASLFGINLKIIIGENKRMCSWFHRLLIFSHMVKKRASNTRPFSVLFIKLTRTLAFTGK